MASLFAPGHIALISRRLSAGLHALAGSAISKSDTKRIQHKPMMSPTTTRRHGFKPLGRADSAVLLERYWTVPEQQTEASVVLERQSAPECSKPTISSPLG